MKKELNGEQFLKMAGKLIVLCRKKID